MTFTPKERYEIYLTTPHWEEFSCEIRRQRRKCERCGIDDRTAYRRYRQRLNVHHKTYERIGNERPEDVELLCFACHVKHHGADPWGVFCHEHGMPDVRKIPLYCANCEKPTGEFVYNPDEVKESLCPECR